MSQRDPRLIGGVYRTGQVLTSSGILTNYTANNRNTNDVVGLLVIELPSTVNPQTAQQLLQPLQQRRIVESLHVLRIYDWGIDSNRVYIATAPPRGITLQHVLDNENIDLQRALNISQQMTHGLIALHSQGIVGIDLRPQLVTVDSVQLVDRIQLDDLGLRPILNKLGYVTSQRIDDIGYFDPRYAPPEYIQGGPIGFWSDIYQMGLLLFELVTGRLPFIGRNHAETAALQSTSPTPRISQYKPDTPSTVQDVVNRAMAKQPTERFLSATALLSALEKVLRATLELPIVVASSQGPGTSQSLPIQPTAIEADITYTEGPTETFVPTAEKTVESPTETSHPVTNHPPTTQEVIYAHLCHEQDGVETKRFAITKPNVIVGRKDPRRGLSPDIDLTALDPNMTVSRQHTRIHYQEASFYIEDLKSHNKTRLDELTLHPLKPELLQHGNIVHFGAVRLVFKIPEIKDKFDGNI